MRFDSFLSVNDDTESDAERPESEEEEELTTPYPLEGKYTDELDRERYYPLPFNNTAIVNGYFKATEHV